jgi:hypothetical protein
MGYYVSITYSDFRIPAKNIDEAYKRLCDLNQYDDIKRGGMYGGETDGRNPRPEGMNYHPGKWFSWMYPDYPDHLTTLSDILQELGFELIFVDNGDIIINGYDNKAGQEDLFLDEISDLCDGAIHWVGEDGNAWITNAGERKGVLEDTRDLEARFRARMQEIKQENHS